MIAIDCFFFDPSVTSKVFGRGIENGNSCVPGSSLAAEEDVKDEVERWGIEGVKMVVGMVKKKTSLKLKPDVVPRLNPRIYTKQSDISSGSKIH